MITINVTNKSLWDNTVEGYICFLTEDFQATSDRLCIDEIAKDCYPDLETILKKHQFSGKHGQSFVLTARRGSSLVQFLFIGLGKLDQPVNRELELLRRSFGDAVLLMKKLKIKQAASILPPVTRYNCSPAELIKHLTIAGIMASYDFLTFKTKERENRWSGSLCISVPPHELEACERMVKKGSIIGEAINRAREWGDLPANIMTPSALSHEAQKIAEFYGLKCTVFGREKAIELGMGGFLAVDAGSEQDGKFVILEYRGAPPDSPTIALAGKGVMFDTGGISLKPANFMEGMKYDMSGAAAVIATMSLIAQLKPCINVVGLTPLVENMPSGKASRQDDIIVCMNGKTVEIKNTDAEGRLILADTLCYAEKFYAPAIIIDIATLTGACLHALGYFYTALMTKDQKLQETLWAIGDRTGDRVWPLPLDDDFMPANESRFADVSNSEKGGYKAGSITAGCFLSNFVSKARWAHLDIAGTADSVPGNNSYIGKGATGAGIRLLTEFIMKYAECNRS